MTDISKLRELLGRVESADGPNFQLEKDINELVDVGYQLRLPNYTSSIDAAVALCERVLPKNHWCVERISEYPALANLRYHFVARAGSYGSPKRAEGPTPALALCAAILRAKIATLEKATEHQEGK